MVKLTLIQGDCLKILPKLPDESVDLIITDPPYGINYQSKRRKNNKFGKIVNDDKLDWVDPVLSELYRVLKNNSCFYCFTRWDVYPFWKDAIERAGFKVKNCLIWHKLESLGGMGDLESSYISNYEFIIFAMKGRRILWEKGLGRKHGYFRNIEIDTPTKLLHPNLKPISLVKEFILDASNEGDVVLDPFLGSGTTMLACLETERYCIGVEIDPKYIMVTKKRINWGSSFGNVEFEFLTEKDFENDEKG